MMGGAVCINAMSFDAMRVRAALATGARLWHLLVIKNLALLCIVAPIGFLLSALSGARTRLQRLSSGFTPLPRTR